MKNLVSHRIPLNPTSVKAPHTDIVSILRADSSITWRARAGSRRRGQPLVAESSRPALPAPHGPLQRAAFPYSKRARAARAPLTPFPNIRVLCADTRRARPACLSGLPRRALPACARCERVDAWPLLPDIQYKSAEGRVSSYPVRQPAAADRRCNSPRVRDGLFSRLPYSSSSMSSVSSAPQSWPRPLLCLRLATTLPSFSSKISVRRLALSSRRLRSRSSSTSASAP